MMRICTSKCILFVLSVLSVTGCGPFDRQEHTFGHSGYRASDRMQNKTNIGGEGLIVSDEYNGKPVPTNYTTAGNLKIIDRLQPEIKDTPADKAFAKSIASLEIFKTNEKGDVVQSKPTQLKVRLVFRTIAEDKKTANELVFTAPLKKEAKNRLSANHTLSENEKTPGPIHALDVLCSDSDCNLILLRFKKFAQVANIEDTQSQLASAEIIATYQITHPKIVVEKPKTIQVYSTRELDELVRKASDATAEKISVIIFNGQAYTHIRAGDLLNISTNLVDTRYTASPTGAVVVNKNNNFNGKLKGNDPISGSLIIDIENKTTKEEARVYISEPDAPESDYIQYATDIAASSGNITELALPETAPNGAAPTHEPNTLPTAEPSDEPAKPSSSQSTEELAPLSPAADSEPKAKPSASNSPTAQQPATSTKAASLNETPPAAPQLEPVFVQGSSQPGFTWWGIFDETENEDDSENNSDNNNPDTEINTTTSVGTSSPNANTTTSTMPNGQDSDKKQNSSNAGDVANQTNNANLPSNLDRLFNVQLNNKSLPTTSALSQSFATYTPKDSQIKMFVDAWLGKKVDITCGDRPKGYDPLITFIERAKVIAPIIEKIAEAKDITPEIGYLLAIESEYLTSGDFNAKQLTTSKKSSALGVWQITNATAAHIDSSSPWDYLVYTSKRFFRKVQNDDDRTYLINSTFMATEYLHEQFARFDDAAIGILAYKAGPGGASTITKTLKDFEKYSTPLSQIRKMNIRVAAHCTHINYAFNFLALRHIGQNLKAYGLDKISPTTLTGYKARLVNPYNKPPVPIAIN